MQQKILIITAFLSGSNAQGFLGGLADATVDLTRSISDVVSGEINDEIIEGDVNAAQDAANIEGDISADGMPNLILGVDAKFDADTDFLAEEESSNGASIINDSAEKIEIIADDFGLMNPISAGSDIAAEAQANAAQAAILIFQNSVLESNKINADYQNMNEQQRVDFDSQYEEEAATANEFDVADRETAKYNEMDDVTKSIYDADMLKWIKKVSEDCAASKTAPGCLFAYTVREAETAARVEQGYYEKEKVERTKWDEKRAYENAALVAAQTQQWHVENVPAYGTVGSACSKQNRCLEIEHCCGVFTRFDDDSIQLEGRCHAPGQTHTDDLGFQWTHQCGASKLLVIFTTIFASAYLI